MLNFISMLVLVKSAAMNETYARQVVDGNHIAPGILVEAPGGFFITTLLYQKCGYVKLEIMIFPKFGGGLITRWWQLKDFWNFHPENWGR